MNNLRYKYDLLGMLDVNRTNRKMEDLISGV